MVTQKVVNVPKIMKKLTEDHMTIFEEFRTQLVEKSIKNMIVKISK